jgi:hypothetical protein
VLLPSEKGGGRGEEWEVGRLRISERKVSESGGEMHTFSRTPISKNEVQLYFLFLWLCDCCASLLKKGRRRIYSYSMIL